jgi:hypothetical protein
MIRSHHITLELARQRHRDLVDTGAQGSSAAPAEPSAAPVERREILAVVRGDASVPGPVAEAGAEPARRRPEPTLRVHRISEGRRFAREEPGGHRDGSAPAERKRESVR